MDSEPSGKIRLYYVPFSCRGSTEYLLREAIGGFPGPDYSGIVHVSPTPRKLRDAQKKFHRLVGNPYIPPRFFTFKQLAGHIFGRKMPGKRFPQVLVPLLISGISGHRVGYASVLSRLLKELKQYHPEKGLSLIREDLAGILLKLGIPQDIARKLDDALLIFEKYQAALSGSNYFDEDDAFNYCVSSAGEALDNFPVLIADGFYDMTASEKYLLAKLIEKADSVLISCPDNAEISFITKSYTEFLKSRFNVIETRMEEVQKTDPPYVKYNGVEDEIEGIARHIKSLYVSGGAKAGTTILLTFPKIRRYADAAERIFTRYGLPFSVSAEKPGSRRPPLRDVLSLMESVAEDFPRAKFTTALNSPFFKKVPEAIRTHIPSLSLGSGIIKGRSAWKTLSAGISGNELAETINKEISHVFGILDTLIKIREKATVQEYHAAMRSVLSGMGFEADEEDTRRLREALEAVRILGEFPETGQISFKTYTEYVGYVLSQGTYGREEPGIQIMDFFESRGLEPDHLYFCGLRDGDMPSKPPLDHILPDSVREEYGLVDLRRYLGIQKLNFFRIVGSSLTTHLSYPGLEADKTILPSPYLPRGAESREKIFGIFSSEEEMVRKGRKPYSDSFRQLRLVGRSRARVLRKKLSFPLRVTDIDAYRKCPRRFFIEKILRLEASEIAEYEVEAKSLGTIIHKVMEELLALPFEDGEVERKAADIIDGILKDYMFENYWKGLIRETFLHLLPEILELESGLREEGFFPFHLEMKIIQEVLPGITLSGKIDRIDACGDRFRIIDYKTGYSDPGSEIIRKGKDLQLPLYAAMLGAQGMPVEKAGIYSLREVGVKWIPTKRDKNTFDDYISAALKFLGETAGNLRECRFDAEPLEDFFCSSCPEMPFCPYIHSAEGAGDPEGEKKIRTAIYDG
jgi:ATP-dependent helicase/DNAse subunit B